MLLFNLDTGGLSGVNRDLIIEYISPLLSLESEQYVLFKLKYDGILFKKPIQIVLMHNESGGVSGYTDIGYNGHADCPSLENCWASINRKKDNKFVIYKLNPQKIIKKPMKQRFPEGPQTYDEGLLGFEPSENYPGMMLYITRWSIAFAWFGLLVSIGIGFYACYKAVAVLLRTIKKLRNSNDK